MEQLKKWLNGKYVNPQDFQDSLKKIIEEHEKLKYFHDYFSELHSLGLEVANWHKNGDTEPFDNFFEAAETEENPCTQ